MDVIISMLWLKLNHVRKRGLLQLFVIDSYLNIRLMLAYFIRVWNAHFKQTWKPHVRPFTKWKIAVTLTTALVVVKWTPYNISNDIQVVGIAIVFRFICLHWQRTHRMYFSCIIVICYYKFIRFRFNKMATRIPHLFQTRSPTIRATHH